MKFHNSSVRCFSCVIAYGNDYMGTYVCIIYIAIYIYFWSDEYVQVWFLKILLLFSTIPKLVL